MPTLKNLPTIGSTALVTFINQSIADVPAKVDTGADTSSVWASNIVEKNGVLSFELFSKGAAWHTGKVIKTKKYSVLMIKNSFGSKELRYKVPLRIELNGAMLSTRFTLADRSKNTYPILIGKQTLKDKYIVDVTHEIASKDKKQTDILVMMNAGSPKIFDFYNDVSKKSGPGQRVETRFYKDLVIVADGRLSTAYFQQDHKKLIDFGLIYLKLMPKTRELAGIIAYIASMHSIRLVDSIMAKSVDSESKIYQAIMFGGHSIQTPKTIFMHNTKWVDSFDDVVKELGLPFVFKDNYGIKGRNNFLINNQLDYKAAISVARKNKLMMIAQRFVPNNGYYRLVVFGDRVRLAMFRSIDQKRSHLFKRSIDGQAKLLDAGDLPDSITGLALKAARAAGLEIAGIDIVKDNQTDGWYCLEANISPQIASGAFIDIKSRELAKFFAEEVGIK